MQICNRNNTCNRENEKNMSEDKLNEEIVNSSVHLSVLCTLFSGGKVGIIQIAQAGYFHACDEYFWDGGYLLSAWFGLGCGGDEEMA